MQPKEAQFTPESFEVTQALTVEAEPRGSMLLIHINPYKHFPDSFTEPLGILQLAGTLRQAEVGWKVDLGVIKSEQGLDDLVEHLKTHRYEVVGMSLPLGSGEDALTVLDAISRHKINSRVLMGGNLATGWSLEYIQELLQKYPFTAIIKGWGDNALLQWLEAYESENPEAETQVGGLVYYREGQVVTNPLQTGVSFENAGLPLRVLGNSGIGHFIDDSRDCSHPFCTFCPRLPYEEREQWQARAAEEVVLQAISIAEAGIHEATFSGEEALGTETDQAVKRLEELTEAFGQAKSLGRLPADFGIALSTRSDTIVGLIDSGNGELIARFSEAVLRKVFLGVETGVPLAFERFDGLSIPSQSRRYGKGISPERHLQAVDFLRKIGVGLDIGFIMFDPLVDLGEIEANIAYLKDNDLYRFTSAVLNKMRIQVGARYMQASEALLRRLWKDQEIETLPNLFKETDMSVLQTDYGYFQPVVGDIVSLSTDVCREHWAIAYGIKQWGRSHFTTGEPEGNEAATLLTKMRSYELGLVGGLVHLAKVRLGGRGGYPLAVDDFPKDGEVLALVEDFRLKRLDLWREALKADLPKQLSDDIQHVLD